MIRHIEFLAQLYRVWGAVFLIVGAVSLVSLGWAGLHTWVGRALAGHGPRARMLAIGLAIGNLPLLPFGTALGGYALWVLLHNEGRQVFVPHPPAPPSAV